MIDFLAVFRSLLPRADAWQLTPVSKQLTELFEGLTDLPQRAREYIDGVLLDLFAATTRNLTEWESEFGLVPLISPTEQERRDRIASAWAAQGGQSPRYLQDLLQANWFDVFVHDWWVLPLTGDPPLARNPFTYLNIGIDVFLTEMGEPNTQTDMGEATAEMGESSNPLGYLLVNPIDTVLTIFLGMGDAEMAMGEALAEMGQPLNTIYGKKPYAIPADADRHRWFYYIGGATFGDQAFVPLTRREEFETLIKSKFPAQLYGGIMVTYV